MVLFKLMRFKVDKNKSTIRLFNWSNLVPKDNQPLSALSNSTRKKSRLGYA